MEAKPDKFATLGGIGAIMLWSTTFAFARSLSEQVGPLTAGGVTYLLGGLLGMARLVALGRWRADLRAQSRRYLAGCGLLFIFYSAAIYAAVGLARDRGQVVEVALVNYLWPSFAVLASLLVLKKRANFWLAPGTALALAGVFLVIAQGADLSWAGFLGHMRSNPWAYGLTFAAAVAWALYSNLARRWGNPGAGGAVELFMVITGLTLLGLRFARPEATVWTLHAACEVTGLAVVTAVAYVLWEVAMRRGNLQLVLASSYFTPLLSTVVSCLYLHVAPGPTLWAGCLLLVTGSLLTWRSVTD